MLLLDTVPWNTFLRNPWRLGLELPTPSAEVSLQWNHTGTATGKTTMAPESVFQPVSGICSHFSQNPRDVWHGVHSLWISPRISETLLIIRPCDLRLILSPSVFCLSLRQYPPSYSVWYPIQLGNSAFLQNKLQKCAHFRVGLCTSAFFPLYINS